MGTAKLPGIKVQDTRMIRLLEVLLHGGTAVSGGRTKEIHHAILTAFDLAPDRYGINQLRYDLRKMKAHCLIERDGQRYAYQLSDKGVRVALTFVLFHKQLCGPSLTASFITSQMLLHAPKANSNLLFTKQLTPSGKLFKSWRLLKMFKYSCLRSKT